MSMADIISLIIGIVACSGVIGTWVKNNRKDVKQRTEMETNLKAEIKDVKDDIKHPEYGLTAIKKGVDEQKLYCAKTSTSLSERVAALESNPKRRKKS